MFEFNPGLALWTLVTFIFLLVVLGKFAWGPILKGLEGREKKIRDDLANAEKARDEAEKLMSEYKKIMDRAHKESMDVIENGKVQAEKVRDELIAKAREDANQITENAKKEINSERDQAIKDIKKKAVDLSVSIAVQAISGTLTEEQHKLLVKNALEEFERTS